MSPEGRGFILQQAHREGIKAAAKKTDASGVIVRRENHPKQIYPTNRRISFTGAWRK